MKGTRFAARTATAATLKPSIYPSRNPDDELNEESLRVNALALLEEKARRNEASSPNTEIVCPVP